MNIIAAVDNNWAIGYQNRLLNSIPDDMKFFAQTTKGGVVVMGRKTLESLPAGQPLKDRVNLVITHDHTFHRKGVETVYSIEEALEFLKNFESDKIYVVGGGSIYRQMLPYCDTAHITWMDYKYTADTYFPNLDQDEDWVIAADSGEITYFDLAYEFRLYKRKSALENLIK